MEGGRPRPDHCQGYGKSNKNARSAAEVAANGVLEGDRAIFWGQYNYVSVAIPCTSCAFPML